MMEHTMNGKGTRDRPETLTSRERFLRTIRCQPVDRACNWELGVWADNLRAVHVYKSVGFRIDPARPAKDFGGRTELYLVVETGK